MADDHLLIDRHQQALEALHRRDLDDAEVHAVALLERATAPDTPSSWFVGNAVHHGHVVRGLVAWERGDLDGASEQLLSATSGPTSPQLLSFGPDVVLADRLLGAGRPSVVVDYLLRVRRLWRVRIVPSTDAPMWKWPRPTSRWIAAIQRGKAPDWAFLMHLSVQNLLPSRLRTSEPRAHG